MKSYALIANPKSGSGRALRQAQALRGALGDTASVEILETTHRGAASELAADAVGRVDRVVAVGGDGTLNEVVDGLMRTGFDSARLPELGYLPAGTANAAVPALGLGSDPDNVAKVLANAKTRALDVGMVRHDGGERAFLLWFGAGWDGVIIDALNTTRSGLMGLSGLVGHAPEVMRAVAGYDQPLVTASVDGASFGDHSTVLVTNVGEMAFGSRIAEGADPGDGRFNVVGLPRLSVLAATRLGLRMMTSSLTRAEGVKHELGVEVTLRSDGEVPFQLDGEPIGVLPATVTLMPAAVRLLDTSG